MNMKNPLQPDVNNTNSIDEDEQANYQLDKWSDVAETGGGWFLLIASIMFLIATMVYISLK